MDETGEPVREMAFILMILFLIGCIISINLAFFVFLHSISMPVFLILFVIFLLLAMAMSALQGG